ncbi:MFS family permease [Crossiella equi]|uniref:MFS family permease n=1 Tax=Crossiella equi TaxID=130796 RepID=A0ABS5A8D7_9PSEU|nr:MFS transporter [Crossiella equi]MBP2472542.1 MFS family permease [Crossiella equi]
MAQSGTEAATRRAGTAGITVLVTLAVFAQEVTWNFYDAQVPPLLLAHLGSAAAVGLLMGMDNIIGLFVQPWMAARSDRTRTSWGRRMPYLVVGMPLAALVFLAIPLSAASLPVLIAVIFTYGLLANGFKSISESLMPDFLPPERRGRGNAAVKIASGLTSVVAALLSMLLVDDHPVLAFAIPSALMLLAVLVLGLTVRDSRSPAYQAALAEDALTRTRREPAPRALDVLRDIGRDRDRSRLLVLVAILLFGCAWAASRSLITPYGTNALGLSRGDAGSLTLASGLVYIAVVYPLALLAERLGRLVVMLLGLGLFAAAMVTATLVPTQLGTTLVLCAGAVGGAGFMVNAAVVLWNLSPTARVLGTYTALYNVGWGLGGFLGPALVGAMVDVTGWHLMPVDIALVTCLALVVVARTAFPRAEKKRTP